MNLMRNIFAFYRLLNRRKMVLSRSVGAASQSMTSADLFLLGFAASIGVSVYDMYPIMQTYGSLGLVGFPFAGLVQFIPVLSYSEMTSKKPCMGGPYHYAYHFLSEVKAFTIGWALILCLLSGVSYRLKFISHLIDALFFDGTLHVTFRNSLPFPQTPDVLGTSPDFLAFIIAFILAGMMSMGEKESKSYILVCFICCLTYLSVLMIINIGFVDYSKPPVFMELSFDRLDSLLNAYFSCSQNYVYIYLISFFGEDSVEPTTSVPASMMRLFYCSWAWNTVCPLFILINFRDAKSAEPIQAFLNRVNLGVIHWFVLLGVIAGSLCSVFTLMSCLEKLIVAMARDGLLFDFFVGIAHSSNTYVAPAFFIGLLSGLFAMFMHSKTLGELFTGANIIAAALGPIFVLRHRYIWSLDFLWEYNERTTKKQQLQHANWIIMLLSVSILVSGFLTCYLLVPLHRFTDINKVNISMAFILVTSGVALIAIVCFLILLFSPTNTVISRFKVFGVPFTPVLSIFFVALTAPLIKRTTYYTIGTWTVLGWFVYFFYSITHSKEDF